MSIKKLSYIYANPKQYLLFDINRIIFESENSLKKNSQELFINNRIHFKIMIKINLLINSYLIIIF